MEYTLPLPAHTVDCARIQGVLQDFDPSAVADYDHTAGRLRVSTVVLAIELVFILEQAGYTVSLAHIEHVPSVCCGGCSG